MAPSTEAAGAIYSADTIYEQDLTQKEINSKLNVSDASVRNAYQQFLDDYLQKD